MARSAFDAGEPVLDWDTKAGPLLRAVYESLDRSGYTDSVRVENAWRRAGNRPAALGPVMQALHDAGFIRLGPFNGRDSLGDPQWRDIQITQAGLQQEANWPKVGAVPEDPDPFGFENMTPEQLANWIGAGHAEIESQRYEQARAMLDAKRAAAPAPAPSENGIPWVAVGTIAGVIAAVAGVIGVIALFVN